MARLRRAGPVILSVLLVVTTGALGLVLTARANTKAESLLIQDRTTLQNTLGGLGKQYVLFSLKEGLDYASTGTWQLTPKSAADEARLQSFVQNATFLNYGAAVVTLSAQVLDTYTAGPGLPSPSNAGFKPMEDELLAGQPDVSSVMMVGHVPVVAMAVPIMVGGRTKALFVGFMDTAHSALETYVEQLHYGKTGHGYVVDSAGVVVAGPSAADIGMNLGQPAAVAGAAKGHGGNYQSATTGDEVSYAPLGLGGWEGVTVESASEFFGPIRSNTLHIGLAVLGLLALASALILVLGYRQETVRRRYQELLAHQAYHDSLTGLANRTLLNSRLNQATSRARRQQRGLALLYMDLDGFKPVNDRAGHDVGDELLVAVSARLVRSVRSEDTVARVGGDEFAILMEDVDNPTAARVAAERIVGAVGRPYVVRGHEIVVSASVGIAYSPRGEEDGECLMRDADLAMYRAKDAGKSGYVFVDEHPSVPVL
ncbi:MAG TPA: sensor domain-containing diguanylate cyclase [Acidimicrobiales bacterium]|nr:sensor domain-containing diguanylate cyclase [Acidimicrobiales bacterium]